MIGATVAIISIVSGACGGAIAAAFMETYLQHRAQEEVGEHDLDR